MFAYLLMGGAPGVLEFSWDSMVLHHDAGVEQQEAESGSSMLCNSQAPTHPYSFSVPPGQKEGGIWALHSNSLLHNHPNSSLLN